VPEVKKRFAVGLVVSLIAAGGTGLSFGKLSHVTLEEIRTEQETVTGGTHRWLTSERFDLLLLDIELPRMKGVEFLSWTLSRDPEMAVIMLTGLDIPEVAIEAWIKERGPTS
jgi:DNA-binding NarL/FixJ family response regulator